MRWCYWHQWEICLISTSTKKETRNIGILIKPSKRYLLWRSIYFSSMLGPNITLHHLFLVIRVLLKSDAIGRSAEIIPDYWATQEKVDEPAFDVFIEFYGRMICHWRGNGKRIKFAIPSILSVSALSFFEYTESKDSSIAKFFGNAFLYWKFCVNQFSDLSSSGYGLLKAIFISFYNVGLSYRFLNTFLSTFYSC